MDGKTQAGGCHKRAPYVQKQGSWSALSQELAPCVQGQGSWSGLSQELAPHIL